METTRTPTSYRRQHGEARALRIGLEIKRRRIALGLGQADLAMLSGIARSDYELIESGEWPARSATESAAGLVAAISRALNSELTRMSRAAS